MYHTVAATGAVVHGGAERHEGYGAVVAPFADHEPVRAFSGCLGTGSAFPSADPGGTARARRLVSAQRGIKPGVEYFHSGYLVDDGAEVFCLFAGGVQFFLGNDGGEAFIHENQGKQLRIIERTNRKVR